MGFDTPAWSDYGVAVVSGAAALTGLLFVAVSVNSAWFRSSKAIRGRGASLIVRRFGGLYWLMGVHVCALLTGLLNAWVFLLAAGADKAG